MEVDLDKSAVVVVDMQNAFASPRRHARYRGRRYLRRANVVHSDRSDFARCPAAPGCPSSICRWATKPDLSDSGGPESPNWHKELGIRLMNCRPELKGQLVTEGTWDFAIVDELAPQPGDIVIVKTRYSGFARTTLDAELQARGIRYLFFTGIATNVCVESTLRDAFFLDYWPILITDASMAAGPPSVQEATLFNIESYFGWTIPASEFLAKTAGF